MKNETIVLETAEVKNKRIARNTIFLYIRTFITMIVSLYTSRIILQALGVDDYGVYNVVGGFVGMFSIAVGPISSAVSRFITYGLGKGDIAKVKLTFSTSVNVQFVLGIIIVLIGETFGLWFLNNKLNIPPDSMVAANWVLQCSIISMVIGLINIPFSASIVAHEKMDIFAYMSILEVGLKLCLVFLVLFAPFNKLIFFSVGVLVNALIMRLIYGIYCTKKFEECRYEFKFDKSIFKEMTGFAWWSFLGSTAYIFNTQGVSMLMNIFFGVVLNTAKGLAMQVESAVISFVNSFTTAFSPQITKSYAEGNLDYMYSVMCRGSKFSIYLFLLFMIPLEFEAPQVLKLWLGEEPDYSALFLRLSMLCTATMMLGSPFLQGISATGVIRNYQIAVTVIGWLVFPLTWVAYRLGFSPEIFYWIYFVIYNILVWVRMWFVRRLLGFKIKDFLYDVFFPVIRCGILSVIPALCICQLMDDSVLRLFVLTGACTVTTSITVLYAGMSKNERAFVISRIQRVIKRR